MSPSAPSPETLPRQHLWVPTVLGRYLVAATPDAVVGIWREGRAHFPTAQRYGSPAVLPSTCSESDAPAQNPGEREIHALLRRAGAQMQELVLGRRIHCDLPLRMEGTPFQVEVWTALQDIPYGQVRSYADIAAAVGRPRGRQAVGQAVGANPLSVVVPCHRVVGSDGSLTGYASGLDVKRALLRLEGVQLPSLDAPAVAPWGG